MKTIIINFSSTLRRYKMATLLNVLGLSISFAAFIILMIQVSYDIRFDSSIPDAMNVYRINIEHNGKRIAATPRSLGEGFGDFSPHVKAVAVTNAMYASVFDRYFIVGEDSIQRTYVEKMMEVSAGYMDIFQPEILEGSVQSFLEPDKVLIPQSMAKRISKDKSAIGKSLRGEDFTWTVGGVYKDFPKNSSIKNYILLQLPDSRHWALNYETYVSIDASQNADELLDQYLATIDLKIKNAGIEGVKVFLSPVKDLHFDTSIEFDTVEKTTVIKLRILICLAFLILIIAAINFTNYSIALTPLRIKSINTQKVMGADDFALRRSLVIEAVVICIISFGISLFLVHFVSLTPIKNLLTSDLVLNDNIALLSLIGVIALLTGLFAGLYPAFYITSFTPALVLKGSFGLSFRGRKLRSYLVGIQFVVSFILIVVALFMYIQTYYIQNYNPGFDNNRIITIPTNKQFAEHHELFAREIKSLPGIESVSYSESLLAGRDFYSSSQVNHKGTQIMFQAIGVDIDFLQTINIPLLEGRYFVKSDTIANSENYIIFNERAKKDYNLQIGDKLDGLTVIGFVPDINYSSLRKEIEPMGFYPDHFKRFAYVRVNNDTNIYSAMQNIEKALELLSPGFPFEIDILSHVTKNMYARDNNLMLLIAAFSFLAIILSLMGVFGMVIFENEYKRKEIGVRKVLGSTTKQILERLNKHYIYLLVLSFIIATPISWYIIRLWLQGFAYKTPMHWWVFVIAFLFVTFLTSATVTFQSRRVADANPVDSLKTE